LDERFLKPFLVSSLTLAVSPAASDGIFILIADITG